MTHQPSNAPADDEAVGSLSVLLENWGANESAAVARIGNDYFPRLRALARRTLGHLPGANTEADDVVQSALGSLCRFMRSSSEPTERDRQDIWRLLCHLVVCKSRRRVTRQTRGLPGGRLRPFIDCVGTSTSAPFDRLLPAVSPAEFDVHLADALERLDPTLSRVVLLTLEGSTREEIAEILGCSKRTVIRKLELIRRTLADFVSTDT